MDKDDLPRKKRRKAKDEDESWLYEETIEWYEDEDEAWQSLVREND